ncbi:MarR family winged helix-turn-helix transcriptional regulator [Subtercola lobariae]|uniref:HTH marR-type domain-containing protein n=1 Tax=Subtercola lobariae TaxID=1588641 RepID=A0A917B955_9MICO|nr:MarR family transcriptional regulator [Subtercola lobariae]GGF27808.1 hypothetical protein GCM10011399_21380 [Subtercola lobariae]
MSENVDEVGAELRRAATRLYSRFRAERLEGEVTDAALLVLLVLDKQGQLNLTELASSVKVTLGSVSQTVRRLEQLEYVTKSRGLEDRRTVLFSLTEQGMAAVTASRQHRRDWLNGHLAELSPDELSTIAAAAPILLAIADS